MHGDRFDGVNAFLFNSFSCCDGVCRAVRRCANLPVCVHNVDAICPVPRDLAPHVAETKSEVAAYEFTTLTCIPGNVMYRGTRIQLLDLPGIIEGVVGFRAALLLALHGAPVTAQGLCVCAFPLLVFGCYFLPHLLTYLLACSGQVPRTARVAVERSLLWQSPVTWSSWCLMPRRRREITTGQPALVRESCCFFPACFLHSLVVRVPSARQLCCRYVVWQCRNCLHVSL